MFYRLITAFRYLLVRDGTHTTRFVNWVIPALLAVVSVAAVRMACPAAVFARDGIVDRLGQFAGILPGFYIAALAAVATFQKAGLDMQMPGNTPTVRMRVPGQTVPREVPLTRRRYTSLMFAYLCGASLLLSLAALFAVYFGSPVAARLTPVLASCIKWPLLLCLLVVFWQVMVVTMWGLYYLAEKIHEEPVGPPQGP
jgi:hypothetical protein